MPLSYLSGELFAQEGASFDGINAKYTFVRQGERATAVRADVGAAYSILTRKQ